jgi:hypothetical protein
MLGWNKDPHYKNIYYCLDSIVKAPTLRTLAWYQGALQGYLIGKGVPILEEIRVRQLMTALVDKGMSQLELSGKY